MSNKHTPGPWLLKKARTLAHIWSLTNDNFIGISLPYETEQQKADADLIVQAPILHSQLEAAIMAMEDMNKSLHGAWVPVPNGTYQLNPALCPAKCVELSRMLDDAIAKAKDD